MGGEDDIRHHVAISENPVMLGKGGVGAKRGTEFDGIPAEELYGKVRVTILSPGADSAEGGEGQGEYKFSHG